MKLMNQNLQYKVHKYIFNKVEFIKKLLYFIYNEKLTILVKIIFKDEYNYYV